jgi:hypothetical protein
MRASRSRSIVLLLDCCYGGAFGNGVAVRAAGDVNVLDSFPGGRLGGGRGRAVITASNAMEYAFEGDRLADDNSQRPSVFTSVLVDGLATGDADRDEDGWISLDELYEYVFDRVREQTPHQTPTRNIEMQGELYLARSRRRPLAIPADLQAPMIDPSELYLARSRRRPLAIPADLQAAMIDPNRFIRIGAVSELRTRLVSDNLPAAVEAHDALAEMARNDIRYVAEPAAAALQEAAIRPVEQELHFGRVTQNSSPAHQTIHLLGPALARNCRFEASDNWIQVQETSDGLDVSVDTSTAGRLHGSIALAGPTGEAVINVDVEITPTPPQPAPSTETSPSRNNEGPTDMTPASTPIGTPQTDRPPIRPAPETEPAPQLPPPTAPAQLRTALPHDSSASSDLIPGHTAPPSAIRLGIRMKPELWASMPLLSLGLLTPVPLIDAARRFHDRRLELIAASYTLIWGLVWWLPGVFGLGGGVVYVLLGIWGALAVVATVHAWRLRHRVSSEPSASPPPTGR